jgi:hypothetical protein
MLAIGRALMARPKLMLLDESGASCMTRRGWRAAYRPLSRAREPGMRFAYPKPPEMTASLFNAAVCSAPTTARCLRRDFVL